MLRKDWITFGPKGERPNRLFLWWAERKTRKRARDAWGALPPEIAAYVETLLSRQESRATVASYLGVLRDYALAKEARVQADVVWGEAEGLKGGGFEA